MKASNLDEFEERNHDQQRLIDFISHKKKDIKTLEVSFSFKNHPQYKVKAPRMIAKDQRKSPRLQGKCSHSGTHCGHGARPGYYGKD